MMSALYNAAAMHDGLGRIGAAAMWGSDFRQILGEIQRVADAPAGARVLDIPSGGGFAFRGLRPGQDCHYVAADISPHMLARARHRATQLGVGGAMEFTEANITDLPFGDNTFDLALTFNGLHCLADPRAAVTELSRVIKPGGILRGTTCVHGCGWRHDRLMAALHAMGIFGNAPHAGDVQHWLTETGLEVIAARRSGSIELFEAHKPST
jgi:ubiquinone/menaquinone biosynthesis C-methylase UbiE